ncbi:MAG: hypothetical protein K9H26_13790 [Prolixibacteraceae bacterium]|nr:hypothetical protein [Prolixibacteraceae bacterium]
MLFSKTFLLTALLLLFSYFGYCQENRVYYEAFNKEKDLLLAQFDCKTDVDDLHSVAALATILADEAYVGIACYAVAGAYGSQGGLYVPPNELMEKAFGNRWSDAHTNFQQAVDEVCIVVNETLQNGGAIWVAEAGQSDFSAAVVKKIIEENPEIDMVKRFHVVQHSNWNEESTTPEKLQYIKEKVQYHKIADGNAQGNGTPCFRTEKRISPLAKLSDSHLEDIWKLAITLANRYNGSEGRYNNEAIEKGGLDFSDVSEISWILNIEGADTVEEFFERF